MMGGGQREMMSYRQAMIAERLTMMQMTEYQEAVAETRKMMRRRWARALILEPGGKIQVGSGLQFHPYHWGGPL
jgi:hypothetical protein